MEAPAVTEVSDSHGGPDDEKVATEATKDQAGTSAVR